MQVVMWVGNILWNMRRDVFFFFYYWQINTVFAKMRSLPHSFNFKGDFCKDHVQLLCTMKRRLTVFQLMNREKFSFHNSVNTVNILCSCSRLNNFWSGWSVSTQLLVTWFCTLLSLSERLQRFTRELGNVQVAHVMLDIFLLSTLFSCEWVKSVFFHFLFLVCFCIMHSIDAVDKEQYSMVNNYFCCKNFKQKSLFFWSQLL